MINKVILVGRLTKDLELKKTTNSSLVRFTVACNRRFKSKVEGAPDADFVNCVAWGQSAEYLSKYAHKGSMVGIEGRITTSSYEGKNGRTYSTEVTAESVCLIGSSGNGSKQEKEDTNKTFTPGNEPSFENDVQDDFSNTPSFDISDEELPFF